MCVCMYVCVYTYICMYACEYVSSTSPIKFSALTYSNYRTRMTHTIHCTRSSYV